MRTLVVAGVITALLPSKAARAGSAREYLNVPIDSWLATYNAGYTTSETPEDGDDLVPGIRSNVFVQSVALMNYEHLVMKPAGQPDSRTVRLTLRQLW